MTSPLAISHTGPGLMRPISIIYQDRIAVEIKMVDQVKVDTQSIFSYIFQNNTEYFVKCVE